MIGYGCNQLILKITISKKIRITKLRKERKICKKDLLFDLNYNFECNWPIELFDNKLPDNLASELV